MLPPRFVRDTMYGILDKAITSDLEPADELIKFNFRNLTYIEPVGITILSNLFQWLKKRNVRVQTVTPTEIKGGRNCPLTYLDDSMFFKKYIKKTLTPHAAVRPTTRPLEHVTYANSYQWLPSAVSFKGVTSLNSSFVNSAFIELLNDFDFSYIRQNLKFTNSTAQINSIIKNRFSFEVNKKNRLAVAF